jgi:hypothetical protein
LTSQQIPGGEGKSLPASVEELPLFLTPRQLAVLMNCSKRTLEREREDGCGLPFTKQGRRIYYLRDVVYAIMRERMCSSTAEAKRAAAEAKSNDDR